MKELSTKPYLIRAIHEWCTDSNLTPCLSVQIDAQTRVPMEYVNNGEITLNISPNAAHHLKLSNDVIQFSARFNGVSREILVPMSAVKGIFARETAQGMLFPLETETNATQAETTAIENPDELQPASPSPSPANSGKQRFQVIK